MALEVLNNRKELDSQRKNQSLRKKTTTKDKKILKSHETHIFTFEPRDFWVEPEEADVLHMYIIAKVLSLRYLSIEI